MIRAGPLVCAGLTVICSLRLPERESRAARMTVTLAYATASGCPDVTDFKAVVVGRLGYDPFVEGSPDHVLVRLERRANTMDGRIEWRDAAGKWTGEQTFPSVSTECSGLARAVGFALAVQIQFLATTNAGRAPDGAATPVPGELGPGPEGPGGRTAPSSAPPPSVGAAAATGIEPARTEGERRAEAPPPTEPAGELATRSEATPDRTGGPPPPRWAIGLGPSLGLGLSSSPVTLGRLFGMLQWQHLSIEVAAVAGLPATVRRRDGAGVQQQQVFGGAALCAAASPWNGCLVVNAGQVRMAGQHIERPTSANVAFVQVGLRAAIIQPLGRRLFLDAHADGLLNVTRWTGSLDHVPVWTAPPFGAALGVDAGVRFP